MGGVRLMLWLYDEFETDFTYNGIVLNNAYDSDIHWVLNTMYKLTFKYPTVDNDLYSFIEKGMIVKADEHDRTNLFRIKDIDISENDKCITVTAYQKNYDFSKRLVNNFGRLRVNCMSVLDEWYSNFLSSEKDFSYYSDINAINSFVSHNDDTDNKLRTSFELLGGIADTYSADIDMHDKQISLLERLGRDTEEVLTTAKNISEFVNTSNSDEIVTRIYASSTFKVGDKYDKKDLREQHRQQLKALRESQKEYSQGRNAVKKAQQMKDEIAKRYAKELAKNNKKVKRSGKVIKSYSQIESEVNAKYQARERKSQQRKAESQAIADRKKAEIESLKAQQKEELDALDEEITINLIVESPLINDYPFINEIAVSNNDLRTAEELEEWAMEYFTKQNIDKPKNSIKVTYEQLSEDINRGDTVILKYLKYGVDERIRVVETHYDPMLKKWKEFILGEKEGRLGSEVSNASSGAIAKANAYTDIITMDIERKVKERSENYDKLFKKNTDEINKKIEDGFEKAKASSEVIIAKIDEDLEKKLAPIRNQVSSTVENYNRQFQATNLEISKNRVEATKQIQALTDRVNNIQDISNNETVRELRGLVNGATSKVTELETSITREFTAVKKKNEDSLSAVKAEFTKGVDGLTTKVSSLEEYKNQDGSRTETLKQWVQRDTANQLSRERTEINKIIDNKGFVKNTEFSSKFTESARGITNQLSALETYKNQDGVRVANMQIWAQNNTANQLTAARRSIESWVNEKGYATTSVVENKVQETANSFSREISNVRNSIPTSLGGRNYITDSKNLKDKPHFGSNKWDETVEGDTIILTKKGGSDETGFWFNLTDLIKTQFQNETLTWSIDIKASRNITLNNVGFQSNGQRRIDITTNWSRISHTFINKFTNYYAFVFYDPTINFNNGDKIYIRLPKLEIGNVATDWTPAPEDVETNVNELNTWKQTATETLNTVSSGLNDTVKHSQLRVGADKIDFGSNKVFDGRNLASMLSVSPESIQAITDKLIITPANENLANVNLRGDVTFKTRDLYLNRISDNNKAGDEYYFNVEAEQVLLSSNTYKDLKAMVHVAYKNNTHNWFTEILYPASGYDAKNCSATVKIPDENKEIDFIELIIHQTAWSDFTTYNLKKINVIKKKSAELIVDGSIEGRQIKTGTLETGHHKAGSITSEIIAAKAVKVGNLLVDDAMIDEFIAHKAFINKLWAQQAFINKLNAINFDFTKATGDYIQSKNGNMKWDLNYNSMILKSNASIEFKESGNVLFRRFNGQTAFLNFVNDTTYTESSVVLGGNRNNSFNPNNSSFVGMRVFPRTDKVSFLADTIDMSGGVNENNGFFINVLESKIIPINTVRADLYIGSKSGAKYSLRDVLANILWNIELLHNNKETSKNYSYNTFNYKDIGL
jgi:phage minor structural protein